MSATTPEGKAKKKVLDILNKFKERGEPIFWQSQAGSQFGATGLDLTICYYGQFIAVELKRFDKKGKLSTRQKLTMNDIEDAGGLSRCVDSETSLMEFHTMMDLVRVRRNKV